MTALPMLTTDGRTIDLPATLVETFQTRLRGALLRPGEAAYETTRRIPNGMIDRRPALIACCAGVADVRACVQFAQDHALLVSVRGGGHGVAGTAVCDGGLMIDLARMQGVRVDPVRQRVRAEGGTTWGALDHETQAFGLAATGGVVRSTGIAGLTLGGGHGFLMRSYGLACDNLLAVDVVTADGRVLTASATEHAALFWGLRGGGGNFGIVTSFLYHLHPVGPLLGGLLIYPLAQAREVLQQYRAVTSTAPDALGTLAALATLPDGTPAVVLLIAYNGPTADGERLLHPLRTFGPPLADQVGPTSYLALQSISEHFNPPGLRNYNRSDYLQGLSDDAIATMVEHFATVPTPQTHVVLEHLGGAVARVAPDATAVAYREAPYNMLTVGIWDDPAADAAHIRWARELWERMQPFSAGGAYINYMGDEGEARVRTAYSPATYARLVDVKNTYDPTNMFRLNQNIKPSTAPVATP
jgi:FAD/FMN-containing dehydrogenase